MNSKTIAIVVVIPVIIGLVLLIVEYLIIQPLGVVGLLATVVISLIAITKFEYHHNKILSFLGQQSLKDILSPWLNHQVASIRQTVEDIFRALSMMLPLAVVTALASSSYWIESDLIIDLEIDNKIAGLIIITVVLLYLSSTLRRSYNGLCRLIILTGSLSLFILYVPAIPSIGDTSSITVLDVVFGEQSKTEKLFSIFVAIHLLIVWLTVLILLESKNYTLSIDEENLVHDKLYSLVASDEIRKILAKQNKIKFTEIQSGWAKFIEYPSDDYIYYLRHCVPVEVEDQTVVLGYVNPGDKFMLEDVKTALETDMKSYYGWQVLKVKYTQIDLEERNRIRMLLDKLSVKVNVNAI